MTPAKKIGMANATPPITARVTLTSGAADVIRIFRHLKQDLGFHEVGFAPVGRAPGLRGLTGTIAGTEAGGNVTLDTHTAVFNWPLQFAQPVKLESLKSTLYWQRTNEALLIATPDWQMKNRDGVVRGKVAWLVPADGSSPLLTVATPRRNSFKTAASHPNPHCSIADSRSLRNAACGSPAR